MEPLRTSLSIIMPVFNHRDEVRTMIDSILANDFNAWELLAVDDGSGEDTLQLLESYAAADSRIRVVRRSRQPKGAQTCRNIGLEMVCGEFVIVFDSDDYIAPYCLRQRVEMLQKRTDLDFLVFPSGVYVDERFLTEPHPYAFGFRVAEDDVALFASRRLPFIVWNNIYRTESLRRHNLTWDVNLLSLHISHSRRTALRLCRGSARLRLPHHHYVFYFKEDKHTGARRQPCACQQPHVRHGASHRRKALRPFALRRYVAHLQLGHDW